MQKIKLQKQSKKLLWKNISIKIVHIVSAEKKCNNLFFLELHRRKSILNKRTNYTIFSMLYENYKLKVSRETFILNFFPDKTRKYNRKINIEKTIIIK